MNAITTASGAPDTAINSNEYGEITTLAKELNCSQEELASAIKAAGVSVSAAKEYLKSQFNLLRFYSGIL